MAAHIFWPPLTALVMLIGILIFVILKYGDTLCKARTTPKPQNYELEDRASENSTYLCEERQSYRDIPMEAPEIMMVEEKEKLQSYECAV